MVADALSRKSHCSMLTLHDQQPEVWEEFAKLNLVLTSSTEAVVMEMDSTLEQDIRKGQWEDERI